MTTDSTAIRALTPGGSHIGGCSMTRYVGLDVSQRMTAICIVVTSQSGRSRLYVLLHK